MIGPLVLAVALAFPGSNDGALASVRAKGVLRYGGDTEGGAPYCLQDPAEPSRVVGFEVEIADAIGRALGVKAQFVQCDWKNLVPTLERGEIDLALNGLESDAELARRVRMTRPYYVFAETIAVRPYDAGHATLAALAGARVGTLANTLAHKILRAHAAIETVLYDDDVAPYADLMGGRLDAVVLDSVIANRHLEQGIKIADGDLLRGTYVGALRKGDESLAAAIDAALGRLVASGELREILRKWKVDDERQALLDAPEDPRAKELLGEGPLVPKLTAAHVGLFLQGAVMTVLLSVASFALAMALGVLLCLAKVYGPAPLRFLASAYVEIYRGTPILLQLFVLYFGIAPIIRLPAIVAAIVGLAMNYAAYEAEVYRAGLIAVPGGQSEAARALGLTSFQTLRLVVVPQAFRVALPPMANDFIALLKDTSIVSVITVVELTKQYSITAHDLGSWLVPGALCAGLYFAMSYPLTLLAQRLERKFGAVHPT
jgi:polar amino acid transport system permease protein/polar amino acid transport system substrate-binding protein